ncbi:MAG: hypothetical protein WBA57_19350, partial [Elainellaceae cyanobacterium]
MTQLIQIVPTLPPSIGGVGDYAHCLAVQLAQNFQLKTHFLVSGQTRLGDFYDQRYTANAIDCTKTALLEKLDTCSDSTSVVLLHYVGYGYSKYGTPTWLIDGLNTWKRKYPSARLVTMFHEIAASGPPWKRAFWSSGMQKHLAKRLVQTSDRIL